MCVEQSDVRKSKSLIKLFYTIIQVQAKYDEAKPPSTSRNLHRDWNQVQNSKHWS